MVHFADAESESIPSDGGLPCGREPGARSAPGDRQRGSLGVMLADVESELIFSLVGPGFMFADAESESIPSDGGLPCGREPGARSAPGDRQRGRASFLLMQKANLPLPMVGYLAGGSRVRGAHLATDSGAGRSVC